MKFFGTSFLMRLVFIVLFSTVVLWGVGDVMRESDQASVIDGSIQLARDGQITGRSFYNYDRTYGSYWVLASVYKMMGLEGVGSSMGSLVTVGNGVAAMVLLLGLIPAFLVCGPSRWWEWAAWLACLLAPTFLFSAPLLSSNVISAGFLFGLVVMLRKRGKIGGDIVAAMLAFSAVAARADAVLVMPLIALLSIQDEKLLSALRDRRLWFVAGASVVALVLGSAIYTSSMYQPATFFNPLIFGSFLIFGMNGALVLLLFLLVGLSLLVWRKKDFLTLLVCVSLVVPLIFYWNVMYTPRHLMTMVLALMFFVMLPRGKERLAEFCKSKWGKLGVNCIVLVSVVSMLIGFNMDSMKSGRPCLSSSTLYPTADGHWPMGANAWFYKRLHDAKDNPLDHNQRVWNAWKSVSPEVVPDAGALIKSDGLVSLGHLWLRMMGKEFNGSDDVGVATLFDGRSLLKMPLQVNGTFQGLSMDFIDEDSEVLEIGRTSGEAIYAIGSIGGEASERWEVLQTINQYNGGDDFIVMSAKDDLSEISSKDAYNWLIVVSSSEREAFKRWQGGLADTEFELLGATELGEVFSVIVNIDKKAPDTANLPKGLWLARSSLPGFMQRKNFK